MRKSKVRMMAAVLMSAMLLGGCGEAPYELTETEENIIVNYAAHMVSKYNRYQKEGLTYVEREEETEEKEIVETEIVEDTETAVPEADGSLTGAPEETEELADETEVAGATPVSLSEQFGAPGLEVVYTGAELGDSYLEDDYYAMYPDPGNMYLILRIDLANTGDAPVAVDHLTNRAEFTAVMNGSVTAELESTILLNDFSTFVGNVDAGATVHTVLLFEVPTDAGEVQSVELYAGIDSNNYQIILQNE